MPELDHGDFYTGLRELAESAFPKRCRTCGRVYATPAEFVAATQPVAADKSGLKAALDEDGTVVLELFRNCVCGSTLMDTFSDRRDTSAAGTGRRRRFGELHGYLVARGIDPATAHAELVKVAHGQPSELLRGLAAPRAAGN
jgi:hypothetical protein